MARAGARGSAWWLRRHAEESDRQQTPSAHAEDDSGEAILCGSDVLGAECSFESKSFSLRVPDFFEGVIFAWMTTWL